MASLTGTFLEDILTGSDGDDPLSGYEGNDLIGGNGGNDLIGGGNGNDGIYGGYGYDSLYGDVGNDYLVGFGGGYSIEVDSLFGGTGSDIFVIGDSTESFYINGIDPVTNTDGSYALILDFSWSEGDKIQVNADDVSAANLYHAGSAFGNPNLADTGIYVDNELASIVVDAVVFTSDLTYV